MKEEKIVNYYLGAKEQDIISREVDRITEFIERDASKTILSFFTILNPIVVPYYSQIIKELEKLGYIKVKVQHNTLTKLYGYSTTTILGIEL